MNDCCWQKPKSPNDDFDTLSITSSFMPGCHWYDENKPGRPGTGYLFGGLKGDNIHSPYGYPSSLLNAVIRVIQRTVPKTFPAVPLSSFGVTSEDVDPARGLQAGAIVCDDCVRL